MSPVVGDRGPFQTITEIPIFMYKLGCDLSSPPAVTQPSTSSSTKVRVINIFNICEKQKDADNYASTIKCNRNICIDKYPNVVFSSKNTNISCKIFGLKLRYREV